MNQLARKPTSRLQVDIAKQLFPLEPLTMVTWHMGSNLEDVARDSTACTFGFLLYRGDDREVVLRARLVVNERESRTDGSHVWELSPQVVAARL